MDKQKVEWIFDLCLVLLYLGVSVYFVVEAVIGSLIPPKYIWMVVGILLFFLVLVVLTFKSKKIVFRVIRKVLLVLLSLILMIGSTFQGSLRSAFMNVRDNSSKDIMYVIVKDASSFKEIDDIQSLGYVDHVNELLTYSMSELENYKLETKGYESLEEVFQALDDSKVEAMLISAQQQTVEATKKESTYHDKYRVIHQIEMVREGQVVVDKDLKEPFVVYVSGLDNMGEPTYNGLSDVNMLLMVDPKRHHVEMISVNRDTYVPNTKYDDYPDKLTHLGWDGPQAGAEVLERIFGIEVDYTVKVTFESLIRIIDTIGGIDVDVKLSFSEQDENRSKAYDDLIRLEKGYQHLNGKEALAYARHRKTAGWDVAGREQAQRDIIAAFVNKVLSVEGAMKIGDVLNVAASYVSTNISMNSVKGFVMEAINTGTPWTFGSSTIDSHYEYLFPCASTGSNLDLSSVLLDEQDIYRVHNMYLAMFDDDVKLDEFNFDLNCLEVEEKPFELDKKVITVQNYYQVVPTYYPDFVRHNF